MARKAPLFHSEFKQRLVLSVRAPDGESHRAVALRKLVAEMNERHATGHLTEWLIESLLDRMARDSVVVESIATSAGPARIVELPTQRGLERIEPAEIQRGEDRASPKPEQGQEAQPTPERKPVTPTGLRVMG